MVTSTLVLKILVTPTLIAAASLAGRRYGQAVGGWLVGLPLTSGPVVFFLALEHGTQFATGAALGSLAGALAEAAFCLAYGRLAPRGRRPALATACLAFAAVAAVLQRVTPPLLALAALAAAALVLTLRLMPAATAPAGDAPPPRWDLPARMAITTTLVVGLTEAAPLLGGRLSGVLATFPAYAAILTVFAHRESAASAVLVLRGLLLGLFSFVSFFVVLAVSLEQAGTGRAFLTAGVVTLAVHGLSLRAILPRRVG